MKIRKLVALTLVMVLTACTVPVSTAKAAGETWRTPGDGCYYLEGTDIVVKREGEALHVTGTGAFPSYDVWTEVQRPWRSSGATALIVDSTITSIGSYAFAKMDKLNHIQISASTFIDDETAFAGIAYKPIFRVYNAPIRTKMIGTIPYTSLDSIAAFAQTNSNGACYILDDNKSASEFQNMTNPTIQYVYNGKDEKHPWSDIENNYNGNVITRLCYMDPKNVDYSYGVSAQMRYPGKACYDVYAAFIGDYTYACNINMQVTKDRKTVTSTKPYRYVVDIPKKYVGRGTSYRLMGIAPGQVLFFDDLDTNPSTLTFESDKGTMTFALIYK